MRSPKNIYKLTFILVFLLCSGLIFSQSYPENRFFQVSEDESVNPCNDNTFLNSGDPATIEYDNMISGYHHTIIREADGRVKTWGQNANSNGDNALIPIEVIPENGFNYEGEILKIASGSHGMGTSYVLTSEGLYSWGTRNSATFPNSYFYDNPDEGPILSFTKILPTNTYGFEEENPKSLPNGVNPEEVKMMFVTGYGGMIVTTYSGEVWVMEYVSGSIRGDGTSGSPYWYWHKVRISTTEDGNTDGGVLTNVVAARGSGTAVMALTADGEVYTWGRNTFIGDGSEAQNRPMATQMQKPTPDFAIKQIGMTASLMYFPTYYLLSVEGDLYALGHNDYGQLGDFTQLDSTHWVRVQKNEEGEPLPPIAWISPNEHDSGIPAVNALTLEGELWSWGSNNFNMIGGGMDIPFRFPFTGAGGTEGMSLFAVETGGHTTIVVDRCQTRYGYVGHRVYGSMGDGSAENTSEEFYNFEDTAIINLCGAENTPVITDLTVCNGIMADLNTALVSEVSEDVQWFQDEELTQEVENPSEVGPGTYYVIFVAGLSCDEPLAAQMQVIWEYCPIYAGDDEFILCVGQNSAPQSILDNDWLDDDNQADAQNVIISFEEELPEWLTVDEEGAVYVDSEAPPGLYEFVYQISAVENPNYFASATLFLSIRSSGILYADYAETYKEGAVEIAVLENDEFDQDNPPQAVYLLDPNTGNYVTSLVIPSEGEYFVDSVNSSVHFIPDLDYIGLTDSVEYVIENFCGISDPAEIWVYVIDLRLEMTKSVDRTIDYSEVGQIIEYQITVTNTGNYPIYNIEITDENSEEFYIGFIEELVVGGVQNFTATHIITEEDMEAGFVENIAYAIGEDNYLKEVSIFSYDSDPLNLAELPDPDCPDCTFVLFPQEQEPQEPVDPCNDNAYLNSDDPATIEYDNMISAFHHTIIREADGTVKIWGENANSDGFNALSPVEVIPENGFDYEGEILKMAIGSNSQSGSFILTSGGLYFWGSFLSEVFPITLLGFDINNVLLEVPFFKVLPTNTYGVGGQNPKSLPIGVEPEEVKMMFLSGRGGMVITTYSGEVWVMEYTIDSIRGDGTLGSPNWYWHRVRKSTTENGNTDGGVLTNVVAARGSGTAVMALTAGGEVYTWGWNTFLGDGSEAQDRLMATQMQKPTPDFVVKQIGMTASFSHFPTYYLLSVEGDLYALGYNEYGQLGDFTQLDSTHWVRVQKNEEGEPLPPIAWISPNEHDPTYPAINALTFEGQLWSWGRNEFSMIGGGEDLFRFPFTGAGGLGEMSLFAVETGGHTTIVVDKCQARYGYVGHRVAGSMGDGSDAAEKEDNYNFQDTAIINLCGAENIPVVTDLTVCSGIMADLNTALVNEAPENVQWFLDEELTQAVENPEEVGPGTYYVVFVSGLSCDEPLAAQMQVVWEDCPIYAEDDEFILCVGQNSAPQSILDNDWLNDNQANAQNVMIDFEEELPDWLTIDEDGIIYIAPSAPRGDYSFTYTISDAENPDMKNSAVIHLIIETDLQPRDDYAETDKGVSVDINILENDSPEGEIPPEVVFLIDPETGEYVNQLIIDSEGEYILNAETGIVTFIPNPDFFGETTPVEYVLENSCGSETALIKILVTGEEEEEDCYLKVFEGVSPNGDGKNDFLVIDTGECPGRIKIKIYNRWGTLVFASENYGPGKEVFEGYANQSGVWMGSNQKLPSATYYFIAELLSEDGLRLVEKGYFYLNTR